MVDVGRAMTVNQSTRVQHTDPAWLGMHLIATVGLLLWELRFRKVLMGGGEIPEETVGLEERGGQEERGRLEKEVATEFLKGMVLGNKIIKIMTVIIFIILKYPTILTIIMTEALQVVGSSMQKGGKVKVIRGSGTGAAQAEVQAKVQTEVPAKLQEARARAMLWGGS